MWEIGIHKLWFTKVYLVPFLHGLFSCLVWAVLPRGIVFKDAWRDTKFRQSVLVLILQLMYFLIDSVKKSKKTVLWYIGSGIYRLGVFLGFAALLWNTAVYNKWFESNITLRRYFVVFMSAAFVQQCVVLIDYLMNTTSDDKKQKSNDLCQLIVSKQ